MPRQVTEEHKAALAEGRRMSRAVDAYLKAIARPKRRGRRVSPEELRRRLDDARQKAEDAEGVAQLKLLQQVRDLEGRLAADTADSDVDIDALESAFIDVAADYSESQGISYGTWRDAGVPAAVLKRAGVKRTRS